MILNQEQIDAFHENGVLVVKGFYDVRIEIQPLLKSIYEIIGLLIRREKLSIQRKEFSIKTFDAGFKEIIDKNRAMGGVVYDAIKQIPQFARLSASKKNEMIFRQLFKTNTAGLAYGGQGIRIDIPNEEKFRAPWHQEYLNQLRSRRGMVFWAPLMPIEECMGPVEFCLGSHKNDVFPVEMADDNNPDKKGAYAMVINNEEKIISKYEVVAPLTNLGDLVLVDWLVLHRSGENISDRCRWSMQTRYFDFEDKTGMLNYWVGSFASGNDIRRIHPEYIISG